MCPGLFDHCRKRLNLRAAPPYTTSDFVADTVVHGIEPRDNYCFEWAGTSAVL
jgi:hypothetical protein